MFLYHIKINYREIAKSSADDITKYMQSKNGETYSSLVASFIEKGRETFIKYKKNKDTITKLLKQFRGTQQFKRKKITNYFLCPTRLTAHSNKAKSRNDGSEVGSEMSINRRRIYPLLASNSPSSDERHVEVDLHEGK